jgi:cytochrome P450
MTRHANSDQEISGYEIKKDDCIFISPLLVHHSNKYWHYPLDFDPDRFNKKINHQPHLTGDLNFVFIPFGAGPRECIGKELALIQIKMILKHFLSKFQISETSAVPEMNPQTTLLFKKPLVLEFIALN